MFALPNVETSSCESVQENGMDELPATKLFPYGEVLVLEMKVKCSKARVLE